MSYVVSESTSTHELGSHLWVGHYDNRLKLGNGLGYVSILLLSWLGVFSPQVTAVRPSHPTVGMGLKLACS